MNVTPEDVKAAAQHLAAMLNAVDGSLAAELKEVRNSFEGDDDSPEAWQAWRAESAVYDKYNKLAMLRPLEEFGWLPSMICW